MSTLTVLCDDKDVDALWDGIESLPGWDKKYGLAKLREEASIKVLRELHCICRRTGPRRQSWHVNPDEDLRRVANPDQLRTACAHWVLVFALGRKTNAEHDTMHRRLHEYHEAEYRRAMASVVLKVNP